MQFTDHIARRMKLHDLHILMAVAQVGSMNKAAVVLNMTQPAVSRSIAELERVLGVSLLDRNARGVEPTEYGRSLLDCGAAVFGELREGIKNIEFLADPTAGEVRIGSPLPLAACFVAAVIDRLSRRYPRIAFHVVAPATEALHRELSERNVDLLVTWRLSRFADQQFGSEMLYEDSNVVVAGARSPWVRRRTIKLADLAGEAWALSPPESVAGAAAAEAFRANGLDYPRATVVAIPREVRISLVATGRFLTILPASVLRFPTGRSEVKALPVELRLAREPIGIVTLKNRTLSPTARLFIEHAREVAKPLANRKR